MKQTALIAALFLPALVFAWGEGGPAAFDWTLLYSGSWAESRMLHNRGDLRVIAPGQGIVLRAQAIDRNPMDFRQDAPWGDLSRRAFNPSGGLYHRPTSSRLLYGVLDERGLAARIRNPWVRAAPYAESRQPIMADLRNTVSVTGEPQLYLYLSSPFLSLPANLNIRGFASAQSALEDFNPDFSGGLDLRFNRSSSLLLETFYTGGALEAGRQSSWFSDPPRLPRRDFNLYAMSVFFSNPFVAFNGEGAYSETFAYGRGLYLSAGLRLNPPLPAAFMDFLRANSGSRFPARPLSVSFAADEVSGLFTGRDGGSVANGFRCAARLEWRGPRSSLLRLQTSLRSSGAGEDFNRSSSGFSYRFPAAPRGAQEGFPLRLTRFSVSADRNASDPSSISDSFRGSLAFSYRMPEAAKINSLGINLSGTLRGSSSAAEDAAGGLASPSPYPIFDRPWFFDSYAGAVELSLPIFPVQFRLRYGYTVFENKDNQWEIVTGASIRFRHGRFNLQMTFPSAPAEWHLTASWRIEKR